MESRGSRSGRTRRKPERIPTRTPELCGTVPEPLDRRLYGGRQVASGSRPDDPGWTADGPAVKTKQAGPTSPPEPMPPPLPLPREDWALAGSVLFSLGRERGSGRRCGANSVGNGWRGSTDLAPNDARGWSRPGSPEVLRVPGFRCPKAKADPEPRSGTVSRPLPRSSETRCWVGLLALYHPGSLEVGDEPSLEPG